MPQVLTDPTLNPGVITNMGNDLFSWPNVAPASVLGLQAPPTQPLPPGTSTAANLLNPDLLIDAQLKNFPANVYDLTPSSLLTHFMAALLGAGGTGQLRKRQMVARLQQAITSTRFYDLDSFYGALFGAQRGPTGTLPTNPSTGLPVSPYSDLASADAWDQVEAIDALFRERIIQLARAITLGGTVHGLQALAEAITGGPCAVYETWRLIDDYTGPLPGFQTWAQVTTANPTWSAFPAGETWQVVEGIVTFAGLMANGAPNEVVIQPQRTYDSSVAGLAEQGADMLGILSVAEVLKPASSIVSVDAKGVATTVPVPVASAWADSQYWEIVHMVTPPDGTAPSYAALVSSYQANNASELPPGTYVIPKPPLSRSTGSQYSYAADVTTATAAAATGPDPNSAVITNGLDYESVAFPGTFVFMEYLPSQAVLPPAKAKTVRTSSPVTVIAAPWSGPRVPIARES